MELNEFISSSIKSVITGIKDTEEIAKSNNAIVNPVLNRSTRNQSDTTIAFDGAEGIRFLTEIEFDVAVAVSNEEATKVGGGFKIEVLSLGASKGKTAIDQTTSRIKFSINVALPIQEYEYKKKSS